MLLVSERGTRKTMTNYERGANFERRVKKEYEKLGYYVMRSAGSHGVADLVALKRNTIPIIIQCKIYEDWKKRQEDIIAVAKKLGIRALYIWRLQVPPYTINTKVLA